MLKHEEIVKTPEYWLETLQNEIYRLVEHYIKAKNISQSDFAKELGVTRGYVSQILNGEFNYTLKKLIELSLAVGKAPEINFTSIQSYISAEKKRIEILYQPMKTISYGNSFMHIGENSGALDYAKTSPNPIEAIAA